MSGPGIFYPPVAALGIWNVRKVTTGPVVAAPGDFILCDTTLGNITITGPATADAPWGAKKISSDVNTAVLAASAGNIDGLATQTIALQWGSYTILGNGTGANITATT